jgi:hypothetical protein
MKKIISFCSAFLIIAANYAQAQLLAYQSNKKAADYPAWLYPVTQPALAGSIQTGKPKQQLSPYAVINGSGTLNFIPKFTPTGIDIGNSQIFDNGTNLGIGTASPAYKLHIAYSGVWGLKVQSFSSSSITDIDAFNGDAAIRFQRNGTTMWGIRNNPTANDFELFEYGIGSRIRIQKGTGFVGINTAVPTAMLHVNGDITVIGTKAFTIDHPLDPENKMLRHFAIESNEVLNSYSGNAVTNEKGTAIVELPGYFEAINKDFRYQLTVIGSFAQAIISKEIKGNKFEIATSIPNVKVSWEVKGVRNDGHMKNVNKMKAEEIKPANMKGKYLEPKAFNLPESRGVNYEETPLPQMNSSTGNGSQVTQQTGNNSNGLTLQPLQKAVPTAALPGVSSKNKTTEVVAKTRPGQ